jgi:hypothetical protein
MAYWNKRPEGWLPRYCCLKFQTNMIMRPKWCKENDKRHCEGCSQKGDYIDKPKERNSRTRTDVS